MKNTSPKPLPSLSGIATALVRWLLYITLTLTSQTGYSEDCPLNAEHIPDLTGYGNQPSTNDVKKNTFPPGITIYEYTSTNYRKLEVVDNTQSVSCSSVNTQSLLTETSYLTSLNAYPTTGNASTGYTYYCRVIGTANIPYTCPSGYTMNSTGQCQLTDPFQCTIAQQQNNNSQCPAEGSQTDYGLPEAGAGSTNRCLDGCQYFIAEGPHTCYTRPDSSDPYQTWCDYTMESDALACTGSPTPYVAASNGNSVTPDPTCQSYAECYFEAAGNQNCSSNQSLNFNYSSPGNYTASCTDIPDSSPDSTTQGGNADGNPYNDPNSTQTLTAESIAASIDQYLQNDLSNIERSINSTSSDIKSTITNTSGDISDAINQSNQSITGAINSLDTTSGDALIADSINNLASQLDEQNQNQQGSVTGGENCDIPPSCNGDPINCSVLYQIWKTRCETQEIDEQTMTDQQFATEVFGPESTSTFGELEQLIEDRTNTHNLSDIYSDVQTTQSTECLTPFQFTVLNHNFTFDFKDICKLGHISSNFVMLAALMVSMSIVYRGLT